MANKSIQLNTTALRSISIILAVFFAVAAIFCAKWFLANALSTRVSDKEKEGLQIADFAVSLAPNDPQTHYAAAVMRDKTFLPEDFQISVDEFEKAVALSPNDYLLWLALGKARERNGDNEKAEKDLRKAFALAPNYSQTQWALGNFLIRHGDETEAFTLIRKAAEGDPTFANPAIGNIWQLYEGDVEKIKAYVGDSNNLRAAFASILAREKRFDESLDAWKGLPADLQKSDFKDYGTDIYRKMLEAKKFRAALQVFKSITTSDDKVFNIGQMTNGGFEENLDPQSASIFEWQIADGVEPQIFADKTQIHGGETSLVLIINNKDGRAVRNISQTVAVDSNRRYVFETFYKSDLKTNTPYKWEIVDAADGKVLAATEPVAAKTDWTSLKTEFTASPTTEAVMIRLTRVPCNTTGCPISGKVWFDDFSLN